MDYRLDSYKFIDFSLSKVKKKNFMIKFRSGHKQAWKIYDYVGLSSNFHYDFKNIYFSRCVYCGADYSLYNIDNYQIDHYIPESHISKGKNKKKIHGITNLVYSCRRCNRRKSDYICKEEANIKLLHPDNKHYADIFTRNENFKIVIQNPYQTNEDISRFYKQLRLGSNEKRILYIIMILTDYLENNSGGTSSSRAQEILRIAKERFNSGNFD